jgi:hypothetical protein
MSGTKCLSKIYWNDIFGIRIIPHVYLFGELPKTIWNLPFFLMDLYILACVWLSVKWLAQNILVKIFFNGFFGY